jgi:hypothetical protein
MKNIHKFFIVISLMIILLKFAYNLYTVNYQKDINIEAFFDYAFFFLILILILLNLKKNNNKSSANHSL